MDAKELRIGNYIKARKTTTIDENVVLLDGLQFLDLMMSSNIKYFEPIPLTEQWLIDFGWGCSDDGEYCDNTSLKNVVLMYDVNCNYFEMSLDKDEFSMKLQYVHQIQNLYHALTGKELIKI